MKKFIICVFILCAACQTSNVIGVSNSSPTKSLKSADTIITTEKIRLRRNTLFKGAGKIKVKALGELAKSENCEKMLTMKLTARSTYEEALIETKNRAYRSGANAIAIVDWKELPNSMIMMSHFFSCSS